MSGDSSLPRHVAIIMDGNGRWAKQRGLPRIEGHRAGAKNVRKVARAFADHGIKYLTLFAFSTENWDRPKEEVTGLLHLLSQGIDEEIQRFHQANIKLVHIGKPDRLPLELRRKIKSAIELTKDNTRMTLCLAFDYGGRSEIVDAVRCIKEGNVSPEGINETIFSSYLGTADIPDPDLLIRTGGEFRLSNFLLWQVAYSELYFTPVSWPDFNKKEIEKALLDYKQRQRRFGNL
jgi:undecaprenyl diphosphate synthase